MNTIFIKEVADSVLKGKSIKLDFVYINKTEYIIEINIASKIIQDISEGIKNIKFNIIDIFKNSNWTRNFIKGCRIKKFKKDFSKVIYKNKLNGCFVVYSNKLKNNKVIRDSFNTFLEKYNIAEYINKSTIKDNVDKYIEEYIKKYNAEEENIRPLIIAEDVANIEIDIVKKLNNKYKEINIYTTGKVDKRFFNIINRINNEYGSCISILKKSEKDFKKYNICIFVDESRTKYVKYKFGNKTCYIDFTNKENDKFNTKYIAFEGMIKEKVYDECKIKELYNLYGKITIANIIMN